MNISLDKNIIAFLSNIFIVIAVCFAIYTPLYFMFSNIGLETMPKKSVDIDYYRLNINKIFIKPPIQKVQAPVTKEPILELTQFTLKAIYFNAKKKENTFIIVHDKKGKKNEKSILVDINDKLKDLYTLVSVDPQTSEAIFDKDGVKYNMKIDGIKDKKGSSKQENTISVQDTTQEANTDDSILAIPREKIFQYRNDYKSIWKEISIKEKVVNKKIIGFRIRKIKEGSLFSKLGLRKEDVITHVNDKPLKSYGDAFKIYYNIDNVKRLKLSIQRGSETKEIDYEVY